MAPRGGFRSNEMYFFDLFGISHPSCYFYQTPKTSRALTNFIFSAIYAGASVIPNNIMKSRQTRLRGAQAISVHPGRRSVSLRGRFTSRVLFIPEPVHRPAKWLAGVRGALPKRASRNGLHEKSPPDSIISWPSKTTNNHRWGNNFGGTGERMATAGGATLLVEGG